VNLGTLPDWGAPYGAVLTIAGGTVASNVPAAQSFAIYKPTGFVAAAEHQVEVTYAAAANGAGSTFQGPVAAAQPDGSGYMAELDDNGFLYFGTAAGGGIANYVTFDTGTGIPAGTKVRLSATQFGGVSVCTCEYDIGGGWVTPAGWGNKDFGAGLRFSGGAGGVAGYGNAKLVKMDSLTVKNLSVTTASNETSQDFNGYAAGASLSTLPDWTVTDGAFLTVSGGKVRGNVNIAPSIAYYKPAGFTNPAEHQVVVAIDGVTGSEAYTGVAAAIQPDGSCYHAWQGADATLYFGYLNAAGTGSDYLAEGLTSRIVSLRLRATGTGATRVCSMSYNYGLGWITPSGWENRDFGSGKRLDGGEAGLSAYDDGTLMPATSITLGAIPVSLFTEVTQNFDGYTAATSLHTFPGWMVSEGSFVTVSGGSVTSSAGAVCVAAYEPAGFITAANHQAEVILSGSGDSQAVGAACAIQTDGSCYHCYLDGTTKTLYFGYGDGGGGGADWINVTLSTLGNPWSGVKVRMTVSGTGATRVCTAEYDIGGGWVTPFGWSNRDFGSGKRLDGGFGGISGYSSGTNKIDSLTIRNV
jgi:hypothetical protein